MFLLNQFIAWSNSEHSHSRIEYVTPNQRHFDLADDIFEIRSAPIMKRKDSSRIAGKDTSKAGNNQRLKKKLSMAAKIDPGVVYYHAILYDPKETASQ